MYDSVNVNERQRRYDQPREEVKTPSKRKKLASSSSSLRDLTRRFVAFAHRFVILIALMAPRMEEVRSKN
jgi:hypothetical protein